MKPWLALTVMILVASHAYAQPKKEDLYSEFALYNKRQAMEKDLRERVIAKTFSMPLDSNSEYRYESACGAISQFMFSGSEVEQGFAKMFLRYDSLEFDTRKAFLEAVYASHPSRYATSVQTILAKETDPKLFAMSAVYLFRSDSSVNNSNSIKIRMVEHFPEYDSVPVLAELLNYLSDHYKEKHSKPPQLSPLFALRKISGQKTIYSFQRWNRDYPGLAIVQNGDGGFVRDGTGRLLVFEQLARSGADLPYFITNGSTPQGVFSLQGTDVAHNNFIGPTPNIQMVMPFESNWDKYFHKDWNETQDSLQRYLQLLPAAWKNYLPMMEAWNAGKIGRTEIIAHGTALDPEYFKDKPYYPLTPTLGCLCAKELWNPSTGKLLVSDQLNLVTAFQSAAGNKGFLYVINLDDQQRAVDRSQIELLVRNFETGH